VQNQWSEIVEMLRHREIAFSDGLSDAEVGTIEAEFAFDLPPDLRQLLQTALPSGRHFPDWRSGERAVLWERLRWPIDGICFDIEHANFWFDGWGARPSSLEQAKETARNHVASAPKLIPIYSHRYIPASPHLAGNPVYSVYQTDIIYFGFDLSDYLSREFGISNPLPRPECPRSIEFWELIVS
jgi:hypothetical protein